MGEPHPGVGEAKLHLQPMVKTMMKQTIPLQSTED